MIRQLRLQPGQVEQLATGALGADLGEKGFVEQALQKCHVESARGGPVTIAIEGFAFSGLNPRIQQHIARAAIEAGDGLSGRQQRQVAEAADIQDGARREIAGEQNFVKRRNEGRTLSAGSDVAAAEIGNHGDASQLGQQGGVADLHGEASRRFVTDGLPVTADGADLAGLQVQLSEQQGDALCGESRPAMLGQGGAGQFVPARTAQR